MLSVKTHASLVVSQLYAVIFDYIRFLLCTVLIELQGTYHYENLKMRIAQRMVVSGVTEVKTANSELRLKNGGHSSKIGVAMLVSSQCL